MINHIPQVSSQLEQFPNELILEIFNYMQLNDLVRTFDNLNHRFHSLIYSSNTHLHLLYPDDIHNSKITEKILFEFSRRQRYICRLRLINDDSISYRRLINLSQIRSVIVDIPTLKLIQLISPESFPRLEYLRIGYTSPRISLNKLHQDIFSDRFPFLKKCSLNKLNDTESWTNSPALQALSLWSDSPHIVVQRVLIAGVHLKSLQIFFHWPSTLVQLDDPMILTQHYNLKSLEVHLTGFWSLDKLDSFLTYIPSVKILRLYSSYFASYMRDFEWNFKHLAYIFSCRLPALSCFDCEFIIKNTKKIAYSDIDISHPCFYRIQTEIFVEDESFTRIYTNK